jgi:hypothetical protein
MLVDRTFWRRSGQTEADHVACRGDGGPPFDVLDGDTVSIAEPVTLRFTLAELTRRRR